MLESEKRSLKDNVANKQKFIENLLNFNGNHILSHNIITSSNIIQKKTNSGSKNTVLEKKSNQRSKSVPRVKDGTPALENQVAI